jgi:nitrite reductase (NO-forming)
MNYFKKLGFSIAIVTSLMAFSASSFSADSLDLGVENTGSLSMVQGLPRIVQTLVTPPFLPEHTQIAQGSPKIVEMTLTIVEKEMEVAPGVFAQAMTFNGSNPGPMIVVHQDDYVELTLKNPSSNLLPHNIDFHSATGAMGGGALTNVAPGQQAILRFKADRAGVFVYHCAPGGIMIPFHVVSGMNGAILVLPRDGLKDNHGKPVKYDRAYYVGEQGWYLPQDKDGKFKRYDSPIAAMADTLEVMKTLTPTHMTFNGKVGALTGENAMRAKVGETVLFLHSQANRDTRIHLIGGHGDLVWPGGSFDNTPTVDRETWSVNGGEAGAAIYTFKQPGLYAYVNHNLIEAIMFGASAHLTVEGEWNNNLMEQIQKPSPIQ